MGGVDASDQRVVAYARLMKGSVRYNKVFFYIIEVCLSNAHIHHTKSQNHTSLRALQFRKELVSTLVQGKFFRRDAGFMPTPVALPDIRFNRDHFHYPVSNDTRSTCKIHIQNVKTIYSCAICGVRMCPEPCFKKVPHMATLLLWWWNSRWSPSAERSKREAISKRKTEIFKKLTLGLCAS